jgi:hypothetical protein
MGSMNEIATMTPKTKEAYRTVNIDGLDIYYREAGSKEAPIVLCSMASRPYRTCSVT